MKLNIFYFVSFFFTLGLYSQNNPSEIDPTFLTGSGANGLVTSIEIQNDEKIIIAGAFNSYNGTTSNNIARLNSNGTIDNSFNSGDGSSSYIQCVEIQPDGKILIGGAFTSYDNTVCNGITRLNTDGSIDTTFHSEIGANDKVLTINYLQSGKIIIGGYFTFYNDTVMNGIARLNSDGYLDNTFSVGDGMEGTGSYVGVQSVLIQQDDKIVATGKFDSYNGVTALHIVRLNPDGTMDPSFMNGAFVSGGNIPRSALQNDGKIIICGGFTSYNGTSIRQIARLNTDGSLDNSFTSGAPGNSSLETSPLAISIQSDGKIVIGGNFTSVNSIITSRLTRLNSDRSVDNTFFSNSNMNVNSTVNTIAIQDDGKIIAGGQFTSYNGTNTNRIVRLNGNINDLSTDLIEGSESTIQLFPNPAENKIQFKNLSNSAIIRISTLSGSLVLEEKITSEQTVDISLMNSGIYIVQLELDNKLLFFKLKKE